MRDLMLRNENSVTCVTMAVSSLKFGEQCNWCSQLKLWTRTRPSALNPVLPEFYDFSVKMQWTARTIHAELV